MTMNLLGDRAPQMFSSSVALEVPFPSFGQGIGRDTCLSGTPPLGTGWEAWGMTQWQHQGATPHHQFGATVQCSLGPGEARGSGLSPGCICRRQDAPRQIHQPLGARELCFAPLSTSLSLSLLTGERNPATTKACSFPALMVTPGFQEFDGIHLPTGFASGVSLAPVPAAVILTEVTSVLAGRWGQRRCAHGSRGSQSGLKILHCQRGG